MRRVYKNSKSYQILKYLAVGSGILILSLVAPVGTAYAANSALKSLISRYFYKKSFERHRFLSDLNNLQKRDLVHCSRLENGKVKIVLTRKGKERMLAYQIDEMQLKKPARWDRNWRLILFDIPHSHKNARDALRDKLKNLDFYPLQKSVYITPYPCEDEIDFIASIFNVRKYVLMVYVSSFEGEEKLKYHFGM